jgi:hypothetical protein
MELYTIPNNIIILEVSYLNKETGGLCQFFEIHGDILSVPSNKRISKIKRYGLIKWVWRPLQIETIKCLPSFDEKNLFSSSLLSKYIKININKSIFEI